MVSATLPDESASKVARSILRNNLQVKAGERVTIEAWPHTLPWSVALARESRRLKALPLVLYEDESAYWDSVESGEASTLGTPASHEWGALSKTNVYVHMWGPGDRVRLNALPDRQQTALFRFNEGWYATARKAGIRGARLEIGRPYPTLAAAYGVDQKTWTDQIVAATLVNPNDLERRATPLVRVLRTGRRLHLTHPNGTDLTLGLAKRRVNAYVGKPVLADPKRPYDLLCNLPSGAIRVSLDESVAEGRIVGNRTSYYDDGIATEPTFEFSGGRLTEVHFATGGERFDTGFQKGGVGRDRPGFLAIGLNPELHNTPQVEDIEAGAIMVSVGGNRNLGGKNRSPFFGWAVIAGATAEIDGHPLPLPK
jgi:aminopeptidase